jgi:16S rRNA (uracil1498-N3)-methyltransferase
MAGSAWPLACPLQKGQMMIARLHTLSDLFPGACVPLTQEQTHYLKHVLRRKVGESIFLFNGRQGLWQAVYQGPSAPVKEQVAQQPKARQPLILAFCLIKKSDWLVEKATELGATHLLPLISQQTSVRHFSMTRHEKIIREACEQCLRLDVPQLHAPQKLDTWLKDFSQDFSKPWPNANELNADEPNSDDSNADGPNSSDGFLQKGQDFCKTIPCTRSARWILLAPGAPKALSSYLFPQSGAPLNPIGPKIALPCQSPPTGGWGLIVGPEGGWSDHECAQFSAQSGLAMAHLGPRILRAETAALASLAAIALTAQDSP